MMRTPPRTAASVHPRSPNTFELMRDRDSYMPTDRQDLLGRSANSRKIPSIEEANREHGTSSFQAVTVDEWADPAPSSRRRTQSIFCVLFAHRCIDGLEAILGPCSRHASSMLGMFRGLALTRSRSCRSVGTYSQTYSVNADGGSPPCAAASASSQPLRDRRMDDLTHHDRSARWCCC